MGLSYADSEGALVMGAFALDLFLRCPQSKATTATPNTVATTETIVSAMKYGLMSSEVEDVADLLVSPSCSASASLAD